MLKEFAEFMKQYGAVGLATAVIIGGKLNALVASIVEGFLMPLTAFFIPEGKWRTETLDVGPFHFIPGPIVGSFVDFVIVAWLVFIIAKYVLRQEKTAK